jgi:hypothetical protein
MLRILPLVVFDNDSGGKSGKLTLEEEDAEKRPEEEDV